MQKYWSRCCLIVVCLTLPAISWAKSATEERLDHLEQLLNSQLNMDLISQVERLQQELRELRGLLEEQDHQMQLLNKRQEQLYADLEHRLQTITQSETQKLSAQETVGSLTAEKKKIASADQETSAYEAAYQLMDKKRYQDAMTAFQDFLWQYPEGQFAPNAHYWLGEIFLAEWHKDKENDLPLEKAVNAFKTVTQKYHSHHKAIDSLLKLGLIEFELKHWDKAKDLFNQLKEQYPSSSRAQIAESKLQSMIQEGLI